MRQQHRLRGRATDAARASPPWHSVTCLLRWPLRACCVCCADSVGRGQDIAFWLAPSGEAAMHDAAGIVLVAEVGNPETAAEPAACYPQLWGGTSNRSGWRPSSMSLTG